MIPVGYDEIDFKYWYQKAGYPRFFRTKSGDKYGYVSGHGVLCEPVFEKAGRSLGYNGFSPKNKDLADKIGRYSEVIYKGKAYLFTEKGVLYAYRKRGFFKEDRLDVDFDSGFSFPPSREGEVAPQGE